MKGLCERDEISLIEKGRGCQEMLFWIMQIRQPCRSGISISAGMDALNETLPELICTVLQCYDLMCGKAPGNRLLLILVPQ